MKVNRVAPDQQTWTSTGTGTRPTRRGGRPGAAEETVVDDPSAEQELAVEAVGQRQQACLRGQQQCSGYQMYCYNVYLIIFSLKKIYTKLNFLFISIKIFIFAL
jgi:hypothetical protein